MEIINNKSGMMSEEKKYFNKTKFHLLLNKHNKYKACARTKHNLFFKSVDAC